MRLGGVGRVGASGGGWNAFAVGSLRWESVGLLGWLKIHKQFTDWINLSVEVIFMKLEM